MTPDDPPVRRGTDALRRWLAADDRDVRALDADGFRRWLDAHLARWSRDPLFAARVAVRDVRRANPRVRELERDRLRAAEADVTSPHGRRLRELARELANARKAIDGLTAALDAADGVKLAKLREKLAAYQLRRHALEIDAESLTAASPERRALLAVEAELRAVRTACGLDAADAAVAQLHAARGRNAGRSGERFEQLAARLLERHVAPELAGGDRDGVRVLTGVTLGAARTELDAVVVRTPPGCGPVDVLAVAEAKRNANDLAHGFRQRQENLAWLTDATTGFDPAAYRTRPFPRGRFDRPAVHVEGGEPFTFAPASFARFTPDAATGRFLSRLYLVTRPVPLWGVSSAALSRLVARVASDERFDPDDAGYLATLRDWCRSLTSETEAADVLRLYAADEGWAGRVVLVGEVGG